MITNLVLSGGAIKGFSFIGALQFLEDHNLLAPIRNVISTSAGTIAAFMVCLGMNVRECRESLHAIIQAYNKKEIDIDNLINIYDSLGIDNGSFIWDQLSKMLYSKRKVHDITFRELAQSRGKNLVICASNITNPCTEYFSVDTTPDLSILTAIRASISIPIIMSPIVINDQYYVDGGVFNNFPIEYFDKESKPFRDTVGIVIRNVQSAEAKNKHKRLNLVTYIGTLVDAMCARLNHKTPKESNNHIVEVVYVDEDPYDFDLKQFSFNLDPALLQRYERTGYDAAKQNLTCLLSNKPDFAPE